MQRYVKLNRKIQSLRLSMDNDESGYISLAKELIVKAMKLGTTEFSLTSSNLVLLLPHEVLESDTLVKLSLHSCKIDLQDQKVCWLPLKYLSLSRVCIVGDTFWDIISMCSLIEELILCHCELGEDQMMVPKPGLGVDDFHRLKVLSLKDVKIGGWFFRDLSSRFPCLKDLALEGHIGSEVHICSNSLECISFTTTSVLTAVFDVPRIRKFRYSGSCEPSLSFETIPREWESDISIIVDTIMLKSSWFLELREFLHKLSPSKITLNIRMSLSCSDYDIEGITCLRKPPILVEELTLLIFVPYSVRHPLEDGLFRCCRPSLVNLYWLPKGYKRRRKANNGFTEILHKTLITDSGKKRKVFSEPCAMYDLEEVNVGFLGDDVEFSGDDDECWPLHCKTLPHAAAYLEFLGDDYKLKIRHQLRWAS